MECSKVAVVGLGFLGRGIAACLLGNGFRVVGYGPSAKSNELALKSIAVSLEEMVARNCADSALLENWSSSFEATDNLAAIADCDFVIESVTENAAIKSSVVSSIEEVVAKFVPIGTNTSSIAICDLQKSLRHPERFLGMHWAEPAHATRFLEIVPGDQTNDQTVQATLQLALKCKKEPSLLNRDVPGLIVNRLGYAMYREAISLLASGVADASTIDRSFRNACGLWATLLGPFQWMDLTGGPTLYAEAMKNVLPTLSTAEDVTAAVRELTGDDARGIVNGKGFYRYTPEEAAQAEANYRCHAWAVKQLVDDSDRKNPSSNEVG